jgi:hypothetical protein
VEVADQVEGGIAVAGLANDLEVWLEGKGVHNPLAEEGVVFHHDDRDFFHRIPLNVIGQIARSC